MAIRNRMCPDARAAALIRDLHCPFSWSAAGRLADARSQAAAGRLDPADAYGTRPDPARTRYYRLLRDLSS